MILDISFTENKIIDQIETLAGISVAFGTDRRDFTIHFYCKSGNESALASELPLWITLLGTVHYGSGQIFVTINQNKK